MDSDLYRLDTIVYKHYHELMAKLYEEAAESISTIGWDVWHQTYETAITWTWRDENDANGNDRLQYTLQGAWVKKEKP